MSDLPTAPSEKPQRDSRFWLIFISVSIPLFLSAFDLTGISTALPTIASDLHGENWVWIGSGYALASTALLPFSGGLSEVRLAMSSIVCEIYSWPCRYLDDV